MNQLYNTPPPNSNSIPNQPQPSIEIQEALNADEHAASLLVTRPIDLARGIKGPDVPLHANPTSPPLTKSPSWATQVSQAAAAADAGGSPSRRNPRWLRPALPAQWVAHRCRGADRRPAATPPRWPGRHHGQDAIGAEVGRAEHAVGHDDLLQQRRAEAHDHVALHLRGDAVRVDDDARIDGDGKTLWTRTWPPSTETSATAATTVL